MAGRGTARHGEARRGLTGHGREPSAGSNLLRARNMAALGKVWLGRARYGEVWSF